ncbi:hypothetical protein AB0C76_39735 [Kitasatospora sp. NPDC048722]|uniref:hypothetical protein n=1 Tax=Kitasatospora sp. NPDC048722 TaxID=3155639 RepID=UPI0033EC63BC
MVGPTVTQDAEAVHGGPQTALGAPDPARAQVDPAEHQMGSGPHPPIGVLGVPPSRRAHRFRRPRHGDRVVGLPAGGNAGQFDPASLHPNGFCTNRHVRLVLVVAVIGSKLIPRKQRVAGGRRLPIRVR